MREAITALRAQGIVEVRHGEGTYLLDRSVDLIASLALELVAGIRASFDRTSQTAVRRTR